MKTRAYQIDWFAVLVVVALAILFATIGYAGFASVKTSDACTAMGGVSIKGDNGQVCIKKDAVLTPINKPADK